MSHHIYRYFNILNLFLLAACLRSRCVCGETNVSGAMKTPLCLQTVKHFGLRTNAAFSLWGHGVSHTVGCRHDSLWVIATCPELLILSLSLTLIFSLSSGWTSATATCWPSPTAMRLRLVSWGATSEAAAPSSSPPPPPTWPSPSTQIQPGSSSARARASSSTTWVRV